MWILFAFGSAFFSGLTAILAKCGIQKTDSTAATAVRTIIVLIFSWIMVFIVGSQDTITNLSVKTWIFLILSGLSTGASWLCYFRALQIGNVNKVVPIDKSSTILTMLLAFVFFHEGFTWLSGTAVIIKSQNGNYFICLSGIATGGAWLCYYRALQDGPASVVVPIDKLSILVTIAFSYIVFKEKLSKKSGPGLLLIVLGTFLMIVPTLSA
ncbi:EamA family transporter [Claveliimonas bilis]|uniref:EamA family transporter n=1 Tax=Claveliimonas bilis TaxID=3028070 RepID=UPI00292F6911|nr:EamA family transporter [Claveliimonas bilis]BDZ79432.1 hypothetical protein Lac3_06410 [Claveliimonas bilis]